MTKRKDTKLESEGAEFLVLGHLLIEGISAYKAYVNFPGYDLTAVNPETGKVAKIQVKSRWATDYDKSFPIKNLDCHFVVHVALNRGYSFGKKNQQDSTEKKQSPIFYVFPIEVVKEAREVKTSWNKVKINDIKDWKKYIDKWDSIKEFLNRKDNTE